MTLALEIRDLSVSYGGVKAVRRISLSLHPGELVSLIGSNGAGKSSCLLGVMGAVQSRQQSLRLFGEEMGHMPTHLRVKSGLALVPEGRGTLSRMTVLENLQVGFVAGRSTGADAGGALEEVLCLFPRLRERLKQVAGTLSGGEQQMLVLARALISRPRVLLLDEPSMGLSPKMVDVIFDVIRTVSNQGTTILLVEQNAAIALEIADRGYVMESGAITLYGRAPDLAADPRVKQAYLGE
jgi:branched-chain amino acid transport system ATP-binding protein